MGTLECDLGQLEELKYADAIGQRVTKSELTAQWRAQHDGKFMASLRAKLLSVSKTVGESSESMCQTWTRSLRAGTAVAFPGEVL